MTRVSPHVIATRLTPAQLAATSAAAQARGQSVSEYTRQAIRAACVTLLTAESGSPEYKLAAVADLLELPKDAMAEQIIAAIGELGDDSSAVNEQHDPLAASPDPPPSAKPDAYGFTRNSALAFPTTPAQQKHWVADRAAQRAKRSAKRAEREKSRAADSPNPHHQGKDKTMNPLQLREAASPVNARAHLSTILRDRLYQWVPERPQPPGSDVLAHDRARAVVAIYDRALSLLDGKTGPRADAAREQISAARAPIAAAFELVNSLQADFGGELALEVQRRIVSTRANLAAALAAKEMATRATIDAPCAAPERKRVGGQRPDAASSTFQT